MELVKECKEAGYSLLGTGEMGIGNTTTSAAMAAALLSVPPEIVAGRGAGLSDEGLDRKRQVITAALEKYQLRETEPMRILCSVGGLDIAGLCGVFLGGAKYHMPIVADGVISAVAGRLQQRGFVREQKNLSFPPTKEGTGFGTFDAGAGAFSGSGCRTCIRRRNGGSHDVFPVRYCHEFI